MSVIQKIRDKYARVAVIAIVVALLGFLLMDAFAGKSSLFGSNKRETVIGQVNGKEIPSDPFLRRVADITKRPQYQGEGATQQVVNDLWNKEVEDAVMQEQYDALGLTIGAKELDQLLFGANPPQQFRQSFSANPQDPSSWNPAIARQQYNQIKNSGPAEQKAGLAELVDFVTKEELKKKYTALLVNSVYVPKWFLEKRNVDNSLMAKGAFVAVPYTTISDSTLKISDAEITDYLGAHKAEFEAKDETRSISFVQFSGDASVGDSNALRTTLLKAKDSFQTTADVKQFLLANNSKAEYTDTWMAQKDMTLQNGDTIFKSPLGIVEGPFTEPGFMLMSKLLQKKTQPDTAKVRHILIATATQDPQSGQFIPTKDTVLAKKTADSVMKAIAGGANFDSVMLKLSDDPSKVQNKGVFDSITRGSGLVPEFKDFALNNPVGYKGIVKTSFGYHYMEVLAQHGSSPVYKAAFLVLPIEASPETVSNANNVATLFSGNVKDAKSFDDYYEKNLKPKGYLKLVAQNLHPMDYNINGVQGNARELVKDIFKAGKDDVTDARQVGAGYVVAVVTDVEKPGLPSAASVRTIVEPILRNKKKADQIKSKMGAVADLNAVAAKFGVQVQPADSIRFSGGGVLGYENKVLGAMFNPANKGKVLSEGIAGQNGVYAIRTDAVFTAPVESAAIEDQRKMMEAQSRQQFADPTQALLKRADVKDYRAKFY